MKNIAIIPARSGSKGLVHKNIKMLNGMPLIAYSILAALESRVFDTVMVSTDSEDYADIARQYGAEVPFLRSEQMSGDDVGSWDVVIEVLERYKNKGYLFDTVCLLQPTSPLRTKEDICTAYEFFQKKFADAVTGVCECEHPLKYMMTLNEELSLEEYRKNVMDKPRQMYPNYYRLNGAMFIRKISYLSDEIKILNNREYAFVMDRRKSVDIDSIDDFEYVEFLMNKNNNIKDS